MQEDQHGKDIHTQLDNMQHQLETKLKDMEKKLVDMNEKMGNFIVLGLKLDEASLKMNDMKLTEVSTKLEDRHHALATLETKLDIMQQLLKDVITKLDDTQHQLDMKWADIEKKLDEALAKTTSSESASASASWTDDL